MGKIKECLFRALFKKEFNQWKYAEFERDDYRRMYRFLVEQERKKQKKELQEL